MGSAGKGAGGEFLLDRPAVLYIVIAKCTYGGGESRNAKNDKYLPPAAEEKSGEQSFSYV
jgi:hypothetical protein